MTDVRDLLPFGRSANRSHVMLINNNALPIIGWTVFCVLAASAAPRTAYAQPLDELLAHADATVGEQISQRCAMCHTFEKGGANKMGPNLWNIVGSDRAHAPGFNYSDALKSMSHEKWTYDALNLYIANPHKFAPGDKMPFAGIADEKERADLIAWMRTLSDHPVPLPK